MHTRSHKSYIIPLKEFVEKFGITERIDHVSYYKCGGPEQDMKEEPSITVSVYTDQ